MSQVKTYRSLGLNVPVTVPSTVEEHDALAGRPNATLDDAIDTNVYRGVLGDFRDAFCLAVETASNIKRKTKPVLDAEGKPKMDGEEAVEAWDETEQEFFRRVCAETNRAPETFQDIADSVAATLKYDPSVKERTPAGPKTPPKSVYQVVEKLHEKGEHTAVATHLSKILGRHVDHDKESLARAIHEDALNERRKLASKWVS